MVSSLKSYAGFYQQLVKNVSGFRELGNRLIYEAEAAYAFRQVDRLEEFGSILSSLPIKEYSLIGNYYQGWCAYRRGDNSRDIFEKVFEESETYKSRALFSLASLESRDAKIESELEFYIEAMKYSDDLITKAEALRGIAILKATEGYHQKALKDLEDMAPMISHVYPKPYYDYLNSLAVELGEVGRIYEARNICQILAASPLIKAHPEWQETIKDLATGNRSFVAISSMAFQADNVLFMPMSDHSPHDDLTKAGRKNPETRIISLRGWKKNMNRDMNTTAEKVSEPCEMTSREMLLRILNLISEANLTEHQLAKMLKAVEKIALDNKEQK